MRPYTGFWSATTCPVDTSIRSAPASLNMRASASRSASDRPPGAQSVAETRTDIGLSAGHAVRIALNTSSGKRARFSIDPPYSSVRRLVSGEMKDDSRYPCAACISTMSKPASCA